MRVPEQQPDRQTTASTLKTKLLALDRILRDVIPDLMKDLNPLPDGTAAMETLQNAVENADHESGHLLISLLNRETVVQAYISRLHPEIRYLLGMPGGYIEPGNNTKTLRKKTSWISLTRAGNLLSSGESMYEERIKGKSPTEIVKELFLILAGITIRHLYSEKAPKQHEYKETLRKTKTSPNPLNDWARAKYMIETRLREKSTDADQDETFAIFERIFEQLTAFFKKPKVQRIIDIIATYLLQHNDIYNEGYDITPLIIAELKQNNVTDADLEDIQREYDALVAQTTAEQQPPD